MAVKTENRTQANGVEDEVGFHGLSADPATTGLLTRAKRGMETRQQGGISLHSDNLKRQTWSLCHHTADERCG